MSKYMLRTEQDSLERIRTTTVSTSDASPFRTAVRNIISGCRSSPLALASYARSGVIPILAGSLMQVPAHSLHHPCAFACTLHAGAAARTIHHRQPIHHHSPCLDSNLSSL